VFGNFGTAAAKDRWADFNAWTDPEAAAAVIEAGLATVMVALDATRRVLLPADLVRELSHAQDPLASWLGAALRYYVEAHRHQYGLEGCFVHDAVAIAELLTPGLVTLAQVPVSVDLADDEHRGRTREDPAGFPTTVALDVDADGVRRVLGRIWGT
jgi:inosine-uridine nucleoside N-ribohydrolase